MLRFSAQLVAFLAIYAVLLHRVGSPFLVSLLVVIGAT